MPQLGVHLGWLCTQNSYIFRSWHHFFKQLSMDWDSVQDAVDCLMLLPCLWPIVSIEFLRLRLQSQAAILSVPSLHLILLKQKKTTHCYTSKICDVQIVIFQWSDALPWVVVFLYFPHYIQTNSRVVLLCPSIPDLAIPLGTAVSAMLVIPWDVAQKHLSALHRREYAASLFFDGSCVKLHRADRTGQEVIHRNSKEHLVNLQNKTPSADSPLLYQQSTQFKQRKPFNY